MHTTFIDLFDLSFSIATLANRGARAIVRFAHRFADPEAVAWSIPQMRWSPRWLLR